MWRTLHHWIDVRGCVELWPTLYMMNHDVTWIIMGHHGSSVLTGGWPRAAYALSTDSLRLNDYV
jgi:hypothetical protein